MNTNRKSRQALTLVEVVVSSLLVGFILVSALASVGAATKSWQATSALADGGDLASQLMTEILVLAYQDPNQPPVFGLESGEQSGTVRTNYDDLDDYKDFSDTPPRNRAGTALANYAGWTRIADVIKVNNSDYSAMSDGSADKGLRMITVTVTSPQGKVTTLKARRTTAGGTQQAQGVTGTVVSWVGCDLQAGNASQVSAGIAILNHATDQ